MNPLHAPEDRLIRLYSQALRCYPAGFRGRNADAMLRTFRDAVADSAMARRELVAVTLVDFFTSLVKEHLAMLRDTFARPVLVYNALVLAALLPALRWRFMPFHSRFCAREPTTRRSRCLRIWRPFSTALGSPTGCIKVFFLRAERSSTLLKVSLRFSSSTTTRARLLVPMHSSTGRLPRRLRVSSITFGAMGRSGSHGSRSRIRTQYALRRLSSG